MGKIMKGLGGWVGRDSKEVSTLNQMEFLEEIINNI